MRAISCVKKEAIARAVNVFCTNNNLLQRQKPGELPTANLALSR